MAIVFNAPANNIQYNNSMGFTLAYNFNASQPNEKYRIMPRARYSNTYEPSARAWYDVTPAIDGCHRIQIRSDLTYVKPKFKKRNFNENKNKKNRQHHNIHQPGRTNCSQRYQK